MNHANFVDYLERPARLLQLNYQELKNLVVAFPYSPNLRVMLWLRSLLEPDGKTELYLQRAAGSTFDRAQLLALSRQFAQAKLQLNDWAELPVVQERTEQKAAQIPVPLTAGNESQQTYTAALSTEQERQTLSQMLDELSHALSQLPGPVAEQASNAGLDSDHTDNFPIPEQTTVDSLATPADTREVNDSESTSAKVSAPDGKPATDVDFQRIHQMIENRKTASLARLSARRRLNTATDRQQPTAPANEPPAAAIEQADLIARQSIRDNDDIASESLAALLVNQGQYQKAIKMYKKLCLVIPEKQASFAAIIENLQQKI